MALEAVVKLTRAQYEILANGGTVGDYTGIDNTKYLYFVQDDISVGSATNPVYFLNGSPIACTYSLNKTVPADADFGNSYHTTGSWSGLTYTATDVGGADPLAFTIPTGDTSTTVARGDHTHDTRYVRFDINSQGLGDAEKANARTNIGAGTYSKPSGGIPDGDLATSYLPLSAGSLKALTDTLYVKGSGTLLRDVYTSITTGNSSLPNIYIAGNGNSGKVYINSLVIGSPGAPGNSIFSREYGTIGVDRTYTLPDKNGTFAMTSDLNAYLPLSGGTMTGAIQFGDAYHRISQEDGTTLTRAGGGTINLPATAGNSKGMAILADEGGDYGLLYVGSDGAILANSGDTGYVLRVHDKDYGTDILQVGQTGVTSAFNGDLNVNGVLNATSISENGTALSSKYFGINDLTQQAVTTALNLGTVNLSSTWGTLTASNGYTIRWGADQTSGGGMVIAEKNGQTSIQVDGEIYVGEGQYRLAHVGEAQPASDVYPWAKESSKPSYNFNEIGNRYDTLIGFSGSAPSLAGDVSPFGMALSNEHSANRLAFINPNAISCEYSSDGVNWNSQTYMSDSAKVSNVTLSYGMPVGRNDSSTEYQVGSCTRMTITGNDANGHTYLYCSPKKMLINVSSSGGMVVKIEYRDGYGLVNQGNWVEYGTYSLSGWSGWNEIPLVLGTLGGYDGQLGNNYQLRLTFTMTSKSADYPTTAYVNAIRLFADNCWVSPSTLASTNDNYSIDSSQNTYFPASIYASALFDSNSRVITAATIGSQSVNYASSAGNADTVDGYHAADLVNYGGNQTGIGSGSPFSGATSWFDNYGNTNALIYNSNGIEYSMLGSQSPSRNYGSILRWGYNDTYLYIARKNGGSWQSQDWEKISAGYADSAGYATSAGSAGNADTVDNEHASAFAHIGSGNNLIVAGNEFNFISDNYGGNDGADVWINYTTPSRNNSAKITGYILGNGHGGQLGTIIHSGNIGSQSVNYASSAGDADTVNGYDSSDFVHSNSSITGATKCKITYDSKGLVTAGADLAASDIPDLSATYLPKTGGTITGDVTLSNSSLAVNTNDATDRISIKGPAGVGFAVTRMGTGAMEVMEGIATYKDTGIILSGSATTGSILTIYTLNYPLLTANATIATQEWVANQGYITSSGSCAYATSAGTADDLSSSANPSIASLTANGVYTPTVGTLGNLTLEYGLTPSGQIHKGVVIKGAAESYGVTLYSPSLTGNVLVTLPNANGTLATQEWVANQGYTSNTGTVTSVTIQTGTGLTGGSSTASTTTGSWTIGIDSGYKLPTTTEWNNKSSVSGVNDGTNWTSITIDGTTKAIPSMSGSYLPLSAGSTNTLTGTLYVKAATSGIGGESISSSGDIEIQPAANGKVYIEGLTLGSAQATGNGIIKKTSGITNRTYTFPDKTGTVALTTDIKMYRHDVYITFQNGGCSLAFSVTNTTSSSYTTLPAALKALFGSSLTAHTKTTVPVDIYFNYGTEGVFLPKCQLYDISFLDRDITYFAIGVYNAETVDYQSTPGFYWNNSNSNITKFTYYVNFDATSTVTVSDVVRTV